MFAVPHRKHTYSPPWPVTGMNLRSRLECSLSRIACCHEVHRRWTQCVLATGDAVTADGRHVMVPLCATRSALSRSSLLRLVGTRRVATLLCRLRQNWQMWWQFVYTGEFTDISDNGSSSPSSVWSWICAGAITQIQITSCIACNVVFPPPPAPISSSSPSPSSSPPSAAVSR
jgi:hypothetical protein